MTRATLGVVLAAAALPGIAAAATLQVGPGRPLALPSDAARVAQDGDRVEIDPGTYFDCAVWTASRLTVAGPGAVLTDQACAGKAAFVVAGAGVTLRGIVFRRVRVPDRNGAGVRAEGAGLVVEDCRFEDDEVGILAAASAGDVVVRRSRFAGNGTADGAGADILADRLGRLRVEDSAFAEGRRHVAIASGAGSTELVGDEIAASRAVEAGGGLLMERATLAGTAAEAVLVTGAGAVALRRVVLRGGTLLLRDWGGGEVLLDGNVLDGAGEVSRRGMTLFRLKATAHALLDELRHLAGPLARWARRAL